MFAYNNIYKPRPSAKSKAMERDIIINIILSLITCGIYNIYWNYCEMESVNELLGYREFSFISWALLTLITCGIYHIYFEYKMGCAILDLQEKSTNQIRSNIHLPIISLLLTIFGLWVITDAIQQYEISRLY